MDYQVRILSGKKMSESVKKIVQYMNENPGQKIPKVRATLAQKSIRNEMNRLVIKCSVCSKNTELPFKKKSRLKLVELVELNDSQTETPRRNRKKKKKSKDKTAGLNISGRTPISQLNRKKDNSKTPMLSPVITPKTIPSDKLSTSSKKSKKLNVERLKHILKKNTTTPTSRKNLHSFLTELY